MLNTNVRCTILEDEPLIITNTIDVDTLRSVLYIISFEILVTHSFYYTHNFINII